MSGYYGKTAALAMALLSGGFIGRAVGHAEGKQNTTAREPEPAKESRQVRRARERREAKGK